MPNYTIEIVEIKRFLEDEKIPWKFSGVFFFGLLPSWAGGGVWIGENFLFGWSQIEGCQAQWLADSVAAVRVEEEGHALCPQVAVAVFGA